MKIEARQTEWGNCLANKKIIIMKTVFYKSNDQGNAHIDHKLLQGKHKLPPAVKSTYILLLQFSTALLHRQPSFLHHGDATKKLCRNMLGKYLRTEWGDACWEALGAYVLLKIYLS